MPMILACMEGQTDKTLYLNACKRCGADSKVGYVYCALCSIQEELGEWERPLWESNYVEIM